VESTSRPLGGRKGTLEAAMPSSGTCRNYMDIINSRMMFGFTYECNYWKISTKLLTCTRRIKMYRGISYY